MRGTAVEGRTDITHARADPHRRGGSDISAAPRALARPDGPDAASRATDAASTSTGGDPLTIPIMVLTSLPRW